jgi:neuroligin
MSAGVALPTYLSAFGPSVDGVVVKSNYQEDVITNLLPEFDGYSGSSVAFGARKFQKFEFGSGINKYDLLFGVVTSEALWRFSSNDIQVTCLRQYFRYFLYRCIWYNRGVPTSRLA